MERFGSEFVLGRNDTYDDWATERRKYIGALIDKWQWLLEGTEKQKLTPIDEKHWGAMAMLFENQQLHTRKYAAIEATKTTDVQLPVTYALPIIRKVWPNLVAFKIASVQPMPMSSAGVMQVFYQDFLREDASNTNLVTPDSDYAQSEENAVPKRVKMQIVKQTVEADKKILGASWSQEVEEDARGALNIDIESALITQMSLEILHEIDQIILAEILLWAACGNVNWTWTNTTTWPDKSYYETLGHALIDAEDLIYAQRFRRADWIVAGRRFVRFIRKMQDFVPAPRNQPFDAFKMGVENVGRLTGYWDVYLTSYINQDRAIMGCYPTSVVDTGYVFAPYIPLTPMPKVYAEYLPYDSDIATEGPPGAYINVDKWSRNVRTRYAKKLVVPQLFSTLSIAA